MPAFADLRMVIVILAGRQSARRPLQSRAMSEEYVDARVLLEQDIEPLESILAALARLPAGGLLVIDAPFRPLPLEAVLTGRGCTVTVEHRGEGAWRVEAIAPGAPE